MHAKLKMLKEMLRQMQCAMAEGKGDDEAAGGEAMEAIADAGEEKKIASTDDDDLDTEKKNFMKRGKPLPPSGKGSALVMMKMAAKKPEMKKQKYG